MKLQCIVITLETYSLDNSNKNTYLLFQKVTSNFILENKHRISMKNLFPYVFYQKEVFANSALMVQ